MYLISHGYHKLRLSRGETSGFGSISYSRNTSQPLLFCFLALNRESKVWLPALWAESETSWRAALEVRNLLVVSSIPQSRNEK